MSFFVATKSDFDVVSLPTEKVSFRRLFCHFDPIVGGRFVPHPVDAGTGPIMRLKLIFDKFVIIGTTVSRLQVCATAGLFVT